MKKYRIKVVPDAGRIHPGYLVQVRSWWGLWVNVKYYEDFADPEYAKREAEELLEKLNEP